MQLELPDQVIQEAKLTAVELRIELACSLFDAGRLTLGQGARIAGLTPDDFEAALQDRGIDLNRFELNDIRKEIADVLAMASRSHR